MLVLTAHGDVVADRPWLHSIAHAAHTQIYIDPLETGHSTDVHGQVCFRLNRRLCCTVRCCVCVWPLTGAPAQVSIVQGTAVTAADVKRLHYRCTDNSVLYFAVGTATAR
jgi:hypothetical protein